MSVQLKSFSLCVVAKKEDLQFNLYSICFKQTEAYKNT